MFAGSEFDTPTGYNYLNARYYLSVKGQMVSEDPVFLALGDGGRVKQLTNQDLALVLSDPQNLNSYSYAGNNPIILIDPSGQFSLNPINLFSEQNQIAIGNWAEGNAAARFATDHPVISVAGAMVFGGAMFAGGAVVGTAVSEAYLGGAGTACLAVCGQANKAISLINNNQNILTSAQRDTVIQTIQDPKLQSIFSKLYRVTDKLPGGTAGAIKYESETGQLLSPAGHLQKGNEIINVLNKMLQNSDLSQGDRSITQALVNQLKDVIK